MNISVIIAYKSDPYIFQCLYTLMRWVDPDKLEIIVVDDCSDTPLVLNTILFPNVKIIRHNKTLGVGCAFETGVRIASNNAIILMGSDVMVKNSTWLDIATEYVSKYPNSIGCSVCLSGDPEHTEPFNPSNATKRYGATLLPFALQDELRTDSQIANREPFYIGMLDSRWIKTEPIEDVTEVPIVYGAFYVTTKSWYNTIHGWDNAHRAWGCLEPWISIKSWLYGGSCHVIKDLETLHVFQKFSGTVTPTNNRWDYVWKNKMFLAFTVLPYDEAQRLIKKVYDWRIKYQLPTRPFNLGLGMVQKEKTLVNKIKERNFNSFTRDFDWYLEKFNINKNF